MKSKGGTARVMARAMARAMARMNMGGPSAVSAKKTRNSPCLILKIMSF